MSTPDYANARREQTLLHLQGLALVIGITFAVFPLYDVFSYEPWVAGVVVAADLACALGGVALWWAIRSGRIPSRQAYPVALSVAAVVQANLVGVQLLSGDAIQLFYQAMLVLVVGLVGLDVAWVVATLAVVLAMGAVGYAGTWPLDDAVLHVSFAAMATASLATGIALGRGWYVDRLTWLTERDHQREDALRDALDTARAAERRLDAKVARRTSELRWANEALRRQITERERADETAADLTERLFHAQRVDAVGRLAGGVAHDFNNLITSVIGNVELAQLDVAPGTAAAEALEDARVSAVRAGRLTQQLLGMSRAGSRSEVQAVLAESFTALRQVVGRLLGPSIRLHIEAVASDVVVAMPGVQLDQILLNLAVNARDAMPDGGTLTVKAHPAAGRVHIEVSDSGQGMDAATMQRIFEPYFTTKAPGKGTGLGLATVSSIVESHDGHIDVRSAAGRGTTFLIDLPLAHLVLAQAHRTSPIRIPRGRGERVLVVEDEDPVRRIAVRILKRLGYEAVAAASGEDALRHLATDRPYDLVWTDVMMPGMDGRELAHRLQELRPGTPALFASGYTGDVLGAAADVRDETRFLSKPYDATDVARAVRSALDAR